MVPGSNPGWGKSLREGTIRKGGRSEIVGNQSWLPRAFLAQVTREMSQHPSSCYIGLTLTFGSNGSWFKPWMVQIIKGGNHLEGGRSKTESEVGYYCQPHQVFFCSNIKRNVSIPLYFNTPTCHKKFTGVIPELSKKLFLRRARDPFGRGRS